MVALPLFWNVEDPTKVTASLSPDSVEKPVRGARKPASFLNFLYDVKNSRFMSAFVAKFPSIAVGIVFTAIFVAFVAASCAGLPLLYDGSHYLFRILSMNSPLIPYWRLSLGAFHYPALFAANLTGQLAPAIAVFSALFCSGPILAIALSWFLIRKTKPGLLVWPLISIGLVSVAAQPYRMGENLLTCELAWPLLFGVMMPLTPLRAVSLVGLGLFLAFLHPVAVAFLGVIAAVAIVRAIVSRETDAQTSGKGSGGDRRLLLAVAGGLILIAAIRTAVALFNVNSYETSEMEPARLWSNLRYVLAVPIAPISAVLAVLSGLLLLVSSRVRNLTTVRSSIALSCLFVLISGGLAVFWSSYFVLWPQCWFYLRFLFLLVFALMGLAIIDSSSSPKLSISRSFICVACSIFFAVSACIHWSVLRRFDAKLLADLKASPDVMSSVRKYSWGRHTPFEHWSISSYAVIRQGRKPEKLVLHPKYLEEARKTGKIRFVEWDRPYETSGWFKLPVPCLSATPD